MRGRKPKPTRIKQLAGNPGRRRLNKREPSVRGIPECPAHLDSLAREEWGRILPILTGMQILGSIDQGALAAYCQAYSTWAQAQRAIAKHGMTSVNAGGAPVPSPFIRISAIAVDQMRKLAAEFGMTPSARSRLVGAAASDDDEKDPFAAIAAEHEAPRIQ